MGHNKPVPASAGHIDMDVENEDDFRRKPMHVAGGAFSPPRKPMGKAMKSNA